MDDSIGDVLNSACQVGPDYKEIFLKGEYRENVFIYGRSYMVELWITRKIH